MELQQLYYFIVLLAVGYGCPDPWTIESPMLKPGTLINFKNSTSVGNAESLTWTWVGPTGEVWENRIWHSRSENKMGGSWLFKERAKHTKNVVQLEWEKVGHKTTWNHDSQMIKQPGWRIVVRDVIEVNFIPLESDWAFKVGEDQLFGNGLQSLNSDDDDYDNDDDDDEKEDYEEDDQSDEDEDEDEDDETGPDESRSRKKRSPQFDTGSQQPTEAGFGDWMKSLWNYFFGEGDVARGEPEGVFSRVGKWVRGVSCSMGGPCDREVPDDLSLGPFPAPTMPAMPAIPATVPTLNPDVEFIPEVNDVKK